jgi:hypothetical protein
MVKKFMIGVLGFILVGFTGCKVETPEIQGVVLDEETKQPVEEAWIHATLEIMTQTVQGEVETILRVEPAHTRSNQKGEFKIPPKEFKKPSFPLGLDTKIKNFSVSANTIDDRGGGYYLKDYEGKKKIEVIIYVKSEKGIPDERDYSASLQALYSYCFGGRLAGEVPAVEGGCDEWELDYVITKHERFLNRLGEPKTMDERIQYSGTMHDLGYLYKRKKDYKKALETFTKARDFDSKRKMDLWLREYEIQINELQRIIQEIGK